MTDTFQQTQDTNGYPPGDTAVPGDTPIDWNQIPVESRPLTATEFIDAGMDEPKPETTEPNYDYPDADFVKAGRRKPHAAAYQSKIHDILHLGMMFTLNNQATIPDGAAIIQYGPKFEHAMGDLAAEDKRVAKAIDFISGGTTTPAMAVISAAIPLVLQIIRNHEPEAVVEKKPLRIWRWTLPIKVKFRIKLRRLRPMTHDPVVLTNHVLRDENVRKALARQGIMVGIDE